VTNAQSLVTTRHELDSFSTPPLLLYCSLVRLG